MALDPVVITGARLVTFGMTASEAARYPLQVARNADEGDFRHSLEWPADLASGHGSELTWYIRSYNGAVPPAVEAVQVTVGGEALAVQGEPDFPGVYHFTWTPRGDGPWELSLETAGATLATLKVRGASAA